jgi:hypothetical protein
VVFYCDAFDNVEATKVFVSNLQDFIIFSGAVGDYTALKVDR